MSLKRKFAKAVALALTLATAAGIQAIYGGAVYKRLRPGLIYIFNLTPNGEFYPETVPDL